MRKREEIEKDGKWGSLTNQNELQLEVLLDIRDLLHSKPGE